MQLLFDEVHLRKQELDRHVKANNLLGTDKKQAECQSPYDQFVLAMRTTFHAPNPDKKRPHNIYFHERLKPNCKYKLCCTDTSFMELILYHLLNTMNHFISKVNIEYSATELKGLSSYNSEINFCNDSVEIQITSPTISSSLF